MAHHDAHGLQASREALQDALSAAALLDPLQRQLLTLFLERLVLLEPRSGRWTKAWPKRCGSIRMRCGDWRKCRGWERIRRSRLLPKWGRRRRHSLPPNSWPPGWAVVRGGKKVRKSRSNRSPKGKRFMRRLLNQAANAAIRAKGSVFEILYRRLAAKSANSNRLHRPSGSAPANSCAIFAASAIRSN